MGPRETPAYCHAMARDCERAAASAVTLVMRTQLLDQAAIWWRLAGEPPGYGDRLDASDLVDQGADGDGCGLLPELADHGGRRHA
jgi:hypothetical protein